jgi:hypothetical protein
MRVRYIALLPLAALMTGLVFLLTSLIVSSLEKRFSRSEAPAAFEIVRYETECDSLRRRIEEAARDLDACEAFPGCLNSQNICPVVMQDELMLEYEGLRRAAESRCAEVPVYVTLVSATCPITADDCAERNCSRAPDAVGQGVTNTTDVLFFF